jgi:hypothetical protein
MRDIEVIDSELRLLLAIRRMVREEEGRPPSTAAVGHSSTAFSAGMVVSIEESNGVTVHPAVVSRGSIRLCLVDLSLSIRHSPQSPQGESPGMTPT